VIRHVLHKTKPSAAIRPDTLRDLVEATIHRHLPPEQFKVVKTAEASARQLLKGLVGTVGGQLS
jgi:hypothetical protein